MKTSLEKFKTYADENLMTVQGQLLYKCLLGYAEILADEAPVNEADLNVYMAVVLNNGGRVDITGIIDRLDIFHNVVTVRTHGAVGPNAVVIFSLNDVNAINSLDVVEYEARKAAMESAVENNELDTSVETIVETGETDETKEANNTKTDKTEVETGKTE